MKLKWQQAPVKTQWGDEMVVASVAIDNDHTLSLYCERDQTPKVDAMFALAEQPAQQEPVAWLTEERYAEMHTSKWTPKIQQVFSKDGILESQTIQYAPQSKPVPYPPAQRTWVGLTDEEAFQICVDCGCLSEDWLTLLDAIEAKLKEKNT